jgi:hypothetical protein
MSRHPALALLVLLLPATASVAQSRFELTPFYGFRTGGSFRVTEVELALDVKSSDGYGFLFGFDLNDNMQVEFLWSRQKSSLEAVPLVPDSSGEVPLPIDLPEIDVRADYFHGVFNYGGGPPVFQPYVAIGAGMSAFDSDQATVDPIHKFSFSLATGFKSFFNERVGVRFDARAFGTRIGDRREEIYCDVWGCVTFEAAATFWQGQLVGGVIFAF